MTCRHGDWEKNKPANRLVFGGAGCVADTPVVCQKNESACYNDGFPVVYVSSLNWSVSTYAEGNSWFFDWVFPLQTEGQKEMSKQKAPRSPSWQVASILAVAVLAAGPVAVGVPVAEAQEGVEKCKYLVAPHRPSKRPALHFAESSGEYYYESTISKPNPDGSKNPLYFKRIVESDYVPEGFLDIRDVPFDQQAAWPLVAKSELTPTFNE
ncbi:hypothetical protein D8M19_07035 [Corynebacterium pseudodiphtheriticum]|nr:hypothetical protein D8M19_07035 [Corynebacterium pseudodiphtheriticum]